MWSKRHLRLPLLFAIVVAAFGFSWVGRAAAQGYQLGAPVLAVKTGNDPVFVAAVDVNGDGIPDLIYIDAGATPTNSTTHVMLGDGLGGFTQSALIPTAGVSVAIGNLLGTGNIDIGWLTSEQDNSGIYPTWHIVGGLGDGTFDIAAPVVGGNQIAVNPQTITQLPVFSYLKAGDANGQADTVPEIVAVDTANNAIFAFPIQPSELIDDYTALVKGAGPLTLGVLTSSTYDDILVDSQGNFTAQVFVGSASNSGAVFGVNGGYFSGTGGVQSLALADFNGDGNLDMAAEDPLGQIQVFPGNGDGSFQSSSIGSTSAATDTQGNGGTLILARDLNYDGIVDMLAFSPLGVSVEIGTASGNFNYTGSYSGGPGTGANSQFATADFNSGGGLDVAMDAPNGIVILYGETLIANPEPSYYGDGFTLIADVGPDPGGTVSFEIDGTFLGTSTVQTDGTATWPIPSGNTYAVGVHKLSGSWTAQPGGTPVPLVGSHTIKAAFTRTITASPEPSHPGEQFVITALAAPAGGGKVTFEIDNVTPPLGTSTVGSDGTATLTVPAGNTFAAGPHTLTGIYLSSPGASPIQITGPHQIVAPPTPTGSLNTGGPTAFEAAIPVSLTLSGPSGQPVPTGTVTFSFNGANSAITGTATLVNGAASYTLPAVMPNTGGNPVLPGMSTVTASYSGDSNYGSTTLTAMQNVMLGVTTVTLTGLAPTPVLEPTWFYGQLINGAVSISPQDSQFPLKGTWEQLSNGVPVPGCTALPIVGSECPYGDPIVIPAGPYAWVEQYNGGPQNGDPVNGTGDSSSYNFTVLPDTTTASNLTSSMNPAPVGTAVTFTETLTGNMAIPTGSVQFFADGSNLLGTSTLNAAGQASITTTALTVGQHQITAVYASTLDFNGVTSPALTEIITAVPQASTVSLTSSVNPSVVGQAVTFTAVASVPGPFPFEIQSGTLSFLDGGTVIGTGQIDQFGRATFTTATLTAGSHPITASYPGGPGAGGLTIAASISAVLTQVVEVPLPSAPPGITLTVTPNPITLEPGSTGILQVTVASLSGFNQPATLSCIGTNSSNELGCSFLQQTLPAAGGTTTLDLVTTAPYPCGGNPTQPYFKQSQAAIIPSCGLKSSPQGAVQGSGWRALAIGGPIVAGLFWLWPRRRRRLARLLCLLMLSGVIGLSGCGGNCTNLGTRPGNYSITVQATAGGMTKQVVVNITVPDPS